MSIARDIFCFAVPFTMLFAAVFFVFTVWVVVGGPYLLGPSSYKLLSDSFQITLPVLLPWLMP